MTFRKFINKGLAVAALSVQALIATTAWATETDIGPVYLDSVGVLQVAGGGHLAGNMEIKIRGGFTLPSGMVCSNVYITTLKTTDPDRRMFALLTSAHLMGKAVRLRITDAPELNAFNGRCSLMWVGIDP
ncbi:hypothetical protein OU995_09810 [Roseateles sp. SL47]|uniref:hypothetical protein n=1 Tax=Roseateles sp. SL47 TaxID=2995138 RepID=UPI00226F338D|nr:hypothetical protein [Roseateles sp. SL47]WAC74961.1 hypothetical protein OU995_09810 [Roseateles sp. SL47]